MVAPKTEEGNDRPGKSGRGEQDPSQTGSTANRNGSHNFKGAQLKNSHNAVLGTRSTVHNRQRTVVNHNYVASLADIVHALSIQIYRDQNEKILPVSPRRFEPSEMVRMLSQPLPDITSKASEDPLENHLPAHIPLPDSKIPPLGVHSPLPTRPSPERSDRGPQLDSRTAAGQNQSRRRKNRRRSNSQKVEEGGADPQTPKRRPPRSRQHGTKKNTPGMEKEESVVKSRLRQEQQIVMRISRWWICAMVLIFLLSLYCILVSFLLFRKT